MEEKNYRKSNKFLQKYRFDLKLKRKLSLKRDNDKVFFKNIITNTRNAESFCNFAIKIKS